MSTPTAPWERQENEKDQAWAAFVAYRDMGPGRSIAKVAQVIGREKSKSLLEGWSSRHGWVRRAAAFDQHQEATAAADARATTRAARAAVLDQQAVAARVMLAKGLQALQAVDPTQIDPRALPKWIEAAIRLNRQAVGLPDRIVGDQDMTDDVEVGPVGHLSPEENRARLVLLQREAARRTEEA
jgi:hypothetical protein